MQVLVVEDNPIDRHLLGNTLERHGYHVFFAEDGRQAVEMLRQTEISMVISDWLMPHMSGVDLARAIRQDTFGRYVYIIMLTGQQGTDHIIEGLSSGADDFITKPFVPEELLMRMRTGQRVMALETRDVTIFALAKLAESRDPETGAHLERVRQYTRELCDDLSRQEAFSDRVNSDFKKLMYQTCPLHDIGKVAIPDHVLLKPGRLSDGEYEIMKTHAAEGAKTLNTALEQYPDAAFLKMARDIAISHHERWDGNGYPEKLAGEDIPLCGRIFAIADVYDALITKRVYKNAFTHDVARGIIVEGASKDFDPQIVESFIRCEERFIEINQQFAEDVNTDREAA